MAKSKIILLPKLFKVIIEGKHNDITFSKNTEGNYKGSTQSKEWTKKELNRNNQTIILSSDSTISNAIKKLEKKNKK